MPKSWPGCGMGSRARVRAGGGEAVLDAEDAGLVPEVEQALESDVEEISGAAGRVKNADVCEFGGPILQQSKGGAVEAEGGLGAAGFCGLGGGAGDVGDVVRAEETA